MSFCSDDLNDYYEKTDGRCHVCRKKLAFTNYGLIGARGAWEVDHSRARARGGTDHFHNLLPACIRCNRTKGARTTRSARKFHGHSRAPLSMKTRRDERSRNALLGACVGAVLGRAALGSKGVVVGLVAGALLGARMSADG